MKDYRLTREPYISRLHECTTEMSEIDGSLTFHSDYVFNLAKSTGLRSNKKRHVKKRFKVVLFKTIDDAVKRYSNG